MISNFRANRSCSIFIRKDHEGRSWNGKKKGGVAQDLLAVEMIFAPFVFHIGSLHTYPVFFDLVLESLSGDLELFGSCRDIPLRLR